MIAVTMILYQRKRSQFLNKTTTTSLATMISITNLLALTGLATAGPVQKVLADDGGPSRPNDPDFPLPPALPFNTTIPGVDYDLIAKLRASPNAVTRHALLPDDAFKFDFINPRDIPFAQLKGRGGTLVNALGLTMPALIGNNAAAAIGFTKPCGFVFEAVRVLGGLTLTTSQL